MLRYREEKVSFRQQLSEGLKMIAIVAIFGVIFAGIGIAGCKHQSCSVPDTWKPVLESFGLSFAKK